MRMVTAATAALLLASAEPVFAQAEISMTEESLRVSPAAIRRRWACSIVCCRNNLTMSMRD